MYSFQILGILLLLGGVTSDDNTLSTTQGDEIVSLDDVGSDDEIWWEHHDSNRDGSGEDSMQTVSPKILDSRPLGQVRVGNQCHADTEDPERMCMTGSCIDDICVACSRGTCRHAYDCSYKGEYTICSSTPPDPAALRGSLTCPRTCICEKGSCDSDLDCSLDEVCHGGYSRKVFFATSFDACTGICRPPYPVMDPNDSVPMTMVDFSVFGARELPVRY